MMTENGNEEFVDVKELFQKVHRVTRKRRLIRKETLNKVVKKRKVGRRGDDKVHVYTKVKVNGKPFKPHKEPPVPLFSGYLCGSCENVRWQKDMEGWYYLSNSHKWYCPPCGIAYGQKFACAICGLCFSEDDTDENASNWIQCDVCSRWIMSSCDGIEDISVYDDDNPDHIEYSCPVCQGRMADEPLIFRTKVKKSKDQKQKSTYKHRIETQSSLVTDIAKVEKTLISRTGNGKRKSKNKRLERSEIDILLRKDMSAIRKLFTESVDIYTQQNEEIMDKIFQDINVHIQHQESKTEDVLLTYLKDISSIQNPLTVFYYRLIPEQKSKTLILKSTTVNKKPQ